MNYKHIVNPFPVAGYQGAEFFCDREQETARMLGNLQGGISTALVAVRRIGKTGLIRHVFNHMPKGWRGVYVDILATENLNQFLNLLATAILRAVPEKSNAGSRFWKFVTSLRPVFRVDSLTGEPQVTFDLKKNEVEMNIVSVLQFLEKQDEKILIAIDEFQQILNYPETNTEAWLRTNIQQLGNVVFVFSGSQQHLMTKMFTSPKRPFYMSTELMKLDKIKNDIYRDFIISRFKSHGKVIPVELAEKILSMAETHTYYVQYLCNRIFTATNKAVTDELLKKQLFEILKEQETVFFTYRNMLTNLQWQLLKAIAVEGKVYMPTSSAFINKHGLRSSATVLRSLGTLVEYELIYNEYDSEGSRYYSVYDVLFQRWIEEK